MTREELLSLRERAIEEYKTRVQLGEFDANSGTINFNLYTTLELINHLLEQATQREREAKRVHGKTKHSTD